jgi:purine-binding chemotaxis protein CheW
VIIPVFDLRRRLGLPEKEISRETRIIVLNEKLKSAGLMVDRVRQVVRIPEGDIEPSPTIFSGVESDCLEGIGRSGETMLILLDLPRILEMDTLH